MKKITRVYLFLIRFIGVIAGIVLAGLTVAAFLPSESSAETIYSGLIGALHGLTALCLLLPYSIFFRKPTTALWFFRIFLTLGIIFTFSSFGFDPPFFGILLAIIVMANIWVVYKRHEKFLEGHSPLQP
jgi:hypothetical protein